MGIELVDDTKIYELKHPSGAIFKLRYWTFAMQEEVDKRCVVYDGAGGVTYNVALEREIKVKRTVDNWSGITIPDGNGGYQEAPCTPENKSRLPVGIVFWLVKNIDEMAGIKMPDAEKKN